MDREAVLLSTKSISSIRSINCPFLRDILFRFNCSSESVKFNLKIDFYVIPAHIHLYSHESSVFLDWVNMSISMSCFKEEK